MCKENTSGQIMPRSEDVNHRTTKAYNLDMTFNGADAKGRTQFPNIRLCKFANFILCSLFYHLGQQEVLSPGRCIFLHRSHCDIRAAL